MSKKITFDYWKHLYSNRTEYMFSSEIRDLLSLSARPDIISFAGGLPEVKALSFQKLERYIKRVLKVDGDISLQYGDSEGYYPLKTKLIEVMKLEGLDVVEEDIITTTGGQQALDLLAKVFINPGDVIITESPAYTGALNSFSSYEAKIIGIPVDEDGIDTSALEKKLKELADKKIKVKFIYLVPNFSNPSGVTLSLQRRKKVLDLAKKYNTIILEDNPYGMLRYKDKPIPTIKELDSRGDNHNVIYLSTLSKLFAPGFRIGWIVAPHPILEKIILGVQSTILCVSTFSQRIAYEYFSDPSWSENIDEFIKIYSKRRDVMLKALEESFPEGSDWSKPKGGFFIWLKLPHYLNTKEILADAVRNKVAYVPGSGFYADDKGVSEARLAFCTENTERIEKGIKILSRIIKEKIKLYKSFE
ncbi:MAG TPA: PLP-dependent aminotransferase family protein [Candidatus Hydromicrobium sp.]